MTDLASVHPARKYLPMVAVGSTIFAADQISKAWAHGDWGFAGLERCALMAERPTVGFCLAFNEGMAFSMGWGAGAFISIVVLAVVVTLAVFSRSVSPMQRLVMGAIVGGALGNLTDRAFRSAAPGTSDRGFMGGAVVDFVYSSFWATFNVADAAVVVGGFLLAIAVWRMPDPEPKGGPAPSSGDESAVPSVAPAPAASDIAADSAADA